MPVVATQPLQIRAHHDRPQLRDRLNIPGLRGPQHPWLNPGNSRTHIHGREYPKGPWPYIQVGSAGKDNSYTHVRFNIGLEKSVELGIDTKIILLTTGMIFLLALALGVWKYRQMAASEAHQAHFYVDTAHRAALQYSFATLLIAVFVELSGWSVTVDLLASGVVIFYFVAAIATYIYHGWRRDTDNQLRDRVRGTSTFMTTLIIGEIGGFGVLLAGFVQAQW